MSWLKACAKEMSRSTANKESSKGMDYHDNSVIL